MLGNFGSVAACSRKQGQLNYCETSWRSVCLLFKNCNLEGSPQNCPQFIMWCSNILIEMFQAEIKSVQRNDKFLNHFVKALNKIICRFTAINTVFQFTNQYAFSFSCTNLLVCLIYFRSPS